MIGERKRHRKRRLPFLDNHFERDSQQHQHNQQGNLKGNVQENLEHLKAKQIWLNEKNATKGEKFVVHVVIIIRVESVV